METKEYERIIKAHEVKPAYLKNATAAFLFGGLLALIGQGLIWMYKNTFNVSSDHAPTFMIITLVFVASLLTGLGVYDRFGQIAKLGGIIPITGFANAVTSSAMEGKSEGIILGIAPGILKISGSILVISILSGFFFGIIRYLLVEIGIAPTLDHYEAYLLIGGLL